MKVSMCSPTLLDFPCNISCTTPEEAGLKKAAVAHGVRNLTETTPGFEISTCMNDLRERVAGTEFIGVLCEFF